MKMGEYVQKHFVLNILHATPVENLSNILCLVARGNFDFFGSSFLVWFSLNYTGKNMVFKDIN